jgi:membrane-associated PAP2 superfamily phosphatase
MHPFWRVHALWPAIGFAIAFSCIAWFDLDRTLAHAWYFDAPSQHWLGSGAGEWWARGVLHSQGRWLVRAIAAGALVAWLSLLLVRRFDHWRRAAGFVFCAIVLSTGVVGSLKAITNVDCPWDLSGFGGERPYAGLLADRPDTLPRARCFPGAHASSGFALLCGYFVLRDRSRRRARWALAAGIFTGIAFSIGQEARGAHFVSHDLAAAAIVWFVQLGLYGHFVRRQLRNRRAIE